MIDYNDGKIHGWNGGECPVHPETIVNIWFRGSGYDEVFTAKVLRWSHNYNDGDVIAFRVTKAHREPKTIWVNEYKTMKSGWDTEDEARQRGQQHDAIRIAVEYREVAKK